MACLARLPNRFIIASGKTSFGDALRPARRFAPIELRARYDVGISPLREALTRLASERLVTSVGQRGFRVAPLTAYDVEDTMTTRIVIEREALARSIENGDIAWETAVVAAFHALSRNPIPERAGSGDRNWAAAPSAISYGAAFGVRFALAHGACRPVVRSSRTASHIARKIRATKKTKARHCAGAQANFRCGAFARRQSGSPALWRSITK